MTFFFDRSVGRNLPRVFQLLGIDAIAHDDKFSPNTPDEVWLAAAGQHSWIVITKDDRIRHNQAERQAIIDNRVGCFVLLRRGATRFVMAQILMRAWDDIVALSASEARPFLYAVLADGRVERRSL